MLSAGIDAGTETTKAVIFENGRNSASAIVRGGTESTARSTLRALSESTEKASISIEDIETIVATGVNATNVGINAREIPESLCLARGINYYRPVTKLLLDIGSQKSLAIKCVCGNVKKWVANDRCAAGTSSYLQVAASALQIELYELDEMFFKSKPGLEIQSSCTVFAESEIISFIHNRCRPADIAGAIFRGLAGRLYSQLLELGLEKELTVTGGIARSKAMITALEERVGFKISILENPEIIGALGAAIFAQEKASQI